MFNDVLVRASSFIAVLFFASLCNATELQPSLTEVWVLDAVEATIPSRPSDADTVENFLGVDEDSDGVKDDVEIYIHSNFSGDENTYLRNSLYLLVQGYMGLLNDKEVDSPSYMPFYQNLIFIPSRCIRSDLGSDEADLESKKLLALVMNSFERARYYFSKLDELSALHIKAEEAVGFWSNHGNLNCGYSKEAGEDVCVREDWVFCLGNDSRNSFLR